jgi:hypothetical protein
MTRSALSAPERITSACVESPIRDASGSKMAQLVPVRKISVAIDGAGKYQSVNSIDGLAGLLLLKNGLTRRRAQRLASSTCTMSDCAG